MSLDKVVQWTLKYDPRTWFGHAFVACVLAMSTALLTMWAIPWSLALQAGVIVGITVYTTREILEVTSHFDTARAKFFDHVMDVLVPAFILQGFYRLFV